MAEPDTNTPPEAQGAAPGTELRVATPNMIRIMGNGQIGVDDEAYLGVIIPSGSAYFSENFVACLQLELADALELAATRARVAAEASGTYAVYASMDRLWRGHRVWSDATFGDSTQRGPVGALKHLAKEAMEAADDPADVTEFADCLFLLWDAAHRAGHSMESIVQAGAQKLQVLHTRDYPETPDGEPAEHDRSGE